MKYYIIAGEASGDLHASNLMIALRKLDPSAQFRCWGGDLMQAQGGELVKHYRDLAFMGFSEVAMNIRTIIGNIKRCKEDILNNKPDALILVDYPGFNLRIAEFAYNSGLKVFYYISPQVWAWKKSRVSKIKKFVNRMFVILPFEKEFYARYDCNVDFVGHPLLDMIAALPANDRVSLRKSHGLSEEPIIALLPGSRKQEISKMLPLMVSVIPHFGGYQFVIACAPSVEAGFYKSLTGNANVKLISGATHSLLQNSFAALVTSGTATLETALFNVPEVVCYKGSFISYQIAKRVIDPSIIKYISLVNLIMDKQVVKELIQHDLSPANLIVELKKITGEQGTREKILADYAQLINKLGGAGASEKTARLMLTYL
jgi:lipid-A-disaccharide synthase